jgi:hypothetical protein
MPSRSAPIVILAALTLPALAAAPGAAEKTLARLTIVPAPGGARVECWLTEQDSGDGSVALKLVIKGAAPRPQAMTIYAGGGEDDGPGAAEVRSGKASVLDLPDGKKLVRVDFAYSQPGGGGRGEQTDTTLVAVDGRPRKLLELTTLVGRDRSPVCRDFTETKLSARASGGGSEVVATTSKLATPSLGDDDLPIDRGCKAPRGAEKVVYRLSGDKLEQIEPAPPAQPPPSAQPTPKAATAPESDD